ncbi:MAG TPA: phosphoglucosamine mutase [Acidimicrobiales bacterium]|nr:phosphoglucosamine mutase [Acidimicrobiales bacterium]
MPPRFGTDGIRGVAGTELTAELALALGRAAARLLEGGTWLVGRDTRQSGPMLQAALAAGLAAEGRDVVDLGVLPTPGVAWLASRRSLPAAVISASHNPFADNGIKLLGPGGTKLDLATEQRVEEVLEALLGTAPAGSGGPAAAAETPAVGSVSVEPEAWREYAAHLASLAKGSPMPVGEVVVDCANGAASLVAPAVLEALGVDAHVIFCEPDGTNINLGCGSTHLGPLQAAVRERGAALGIAFDGDADRMLAVDHAGEVVDGDHLIAMFAAALRGEGELAGDAVVVTVLSNLGLRLRLEAEGIEVVETPVGDRHVADALEAGGYVLGGEQSGHLIFRRHAATGDGILTAVKLLELLGRDGRPLAEVAAGAMTRLPQVLLNVPVPEPERLDGAEAVWEAARQVQELLGGAGRVLLRRSGTEPCVRIMVEAGTHELAEGYAAQLAKVVEVELG